MPVTLDCENPECDDTFTVPPSHADDRSHCSRECHLEQRHRKSIVEVECDRDGCDTVIEEQRGNLEWRRREYDGVYCSVECRQLGSRTGKQLTCKSCGEQFYEPQWKLESDRHANEYCSAKCRYGKEPESGEHKTAECEYCGTEFGYNTRQSTGRYCSLSCYRKSLRPEYVEEKPTLECERCGEPFKVPPSKIDEYKYCSEQCRKGIVTIFGEPVMKECGRCGSVKAIEDFPDQYDRTRDSVYTLGVCNQCRAKAKRRRVKLEGSFQACDVRKQWHMQDGECFWCGSRCGKTPSAGGFHIDHLTPVSRSESGPSNYPRNLVIACPECNIARSNKLPIEFKRYRLKYCDTQKTFAQGVTLDLSE